MSIKPVGSIRVDVDGAELRLSEELPKGKVSLYYIPDTHRVVSVELLRKAMSEDLSIPGLYDEMRAIIEDKPCSQS